MLSSSGKLCRFLPILALLLAATAPAQTTIQLDPHTRYQSWQGFGEGGMDQLIPVWYSRYTPAQRDAWLDLMYTLDKQGLGLGLNICRFLMPVGDAPGHNHMSRLPAGANRPFEPEPGVFDWTGHENILWHLHGARDRGALTWASWYAVPYWLTVSGCTAGGVDGSTDNLIPGQEARFVQHIIDVMTHFRDSWGVDFDYVSAINEPDANWWVSGGGQPGCHVSPAQAAIIHQHLKTALADANLPAGMIAFDAAYTNGASYLDALLAYPIAADFAVLSCHQYITADPALWTWATRAADQGKPLWMTEWGDWTNGGYPHDRPHLQAMNYANKIHEAIAKLNVTAWVMWEPDFIVDDSPTGLTPRKSFWATAQFSRHIRPGMIRVKALDPAAKLDATAWISPEDATNRTFALVLVNNSDETRTAAVDLSTLPGFVLDEIRRTSAAEDYAALALPADPRKFTVTLPAGSVLTVAASQRPCPTLEGDANADCLIDLADFAALAAQWLDTAAPPCPHLTADANGDCTIDGHDSAGLADAWLRCTALDPFPADGAADAPFSSPLAWQPHPAAQTHHVYLAASPAQLAAATDPSADAFLATTDAASLAWIGQPATDCYWRVDTVDSDGIVHPGRMWSFTTAAEADDPALLGWWSFDETAGNLAADASPAGNTGYLSGGPTWSPNGRSGGAIYLDGVNDHVDVPAFTLNSDTATFVAWVKGERAVDWAGIVYARDAYAGGLHYGGSDALHYTWNFNDYSTWGFDAGPAVPRNTWAMLALVVEPSRATLAVYTDAAGLQSVTRDTPHAAQALTNLKIGWDSAGANRRFQGLIDEVRIYRRALTLQELTRLTQL